MKNQSIAKEKIPFQLDLLRKAENYQKWILDATKDFLGSSILEIGAGIGNMSRWLPVKNKLILSEVDENMIGFLKNTIEKKFKDEKRVEVYPVDLNKDWKNDLSRHDIDTIVSFNVMEHVENDKQFLSDLIFILNQNSCSKKKRLITFVPAHKFAYGSMDLNYGHYRRYSHKILKEFQRELIPNAKVFYRYFNFIGLPGWMIEGRILKKKQIGEKEVVFFEKICPWIRKMDDFLYKKLRFPFGQSLLFVIEWQDSF